jgi:uncharacterized protein (TIGR03083 family)
VTVPRGTHVPRVSPSVVLEGSEEATVLADEERRIHHQVALAGFAAVLDAAPDATIPFYPEWTVADLGMHLVKVHTMAIAAIETPSDARPDVAVAVTAGTPVDELIATLFDTAERLDAALETTTHTAVWVLRPDRPPSEWRRRMLMEAILHRWDAEAAIGAPIAPEPPVALDGIDEFLHVHTARSLPSADLTGTVELRTEEAVWLLDLATADIRRSDGDSGRAATPDEGAAEDAPGATISGDPASVWLWCNRREPLPADVTLEDRDGSGARFDRFLAGLGRPTG